MHGKINYNIAVTIGSHGTRHYVYKRWAHEGKVKGIIHLFKI